jgi:lipopolysaccharide/colanic/teichoic acid biosynthesis glycosyltransferase
MPFIVERYDDWQRRRLSVPPGITGLWQILGRKDLPMHENLQYDFYYIRNRSLGMDLSLLLRTVWTVLSRRGAY